MINYCHYHNINYIITNDIPCAFLSNSNRCSAVAPLTRLNVTKYLQQSTSKVCTQLRLMPLWTMSVLSFCKESCYIIEKNHCKFPRECANKKLFLNQSTSDDDNITNNSMMSPSFLLAHSAVILEIA